jgi:hypothetical protein
MAADDDVSDTDSGHGIFDGGRDPSWLRSIRGNDVSRIADDKQLSRVTLRQEFRDDAAIRTCDE